MPRPRKFRRVCCAPLISQFGPLDHRITDEVIIMKIDEYETIRLIDVENMTQEECAIQMNVARTSVQRIYNDARKKMGASLVLGHKIIIEGGNVEFAHHENGQHRCQRHRHKSTPNL